MSQLVLLLRKGISPSCTKLPIRKKRASKLTAKGARVDRVTAVVLCHGEPLPESTTPSSELPLCASVEPSELTEHPHKDVAPETFNLFILHASPPHTSPTHFSLWMIHNREFMSVRTGHRLVLKQCDRLQCRTRQRC